MPKTTETPWTLKTPDGATIYGVRNAAPGTPKGAIFMVHGLTGHMYEYPFKRAADYFAPLGYHVYRFNLYDYEKEARNLLDCTVQTHADDLTTVLKKFAGKYKKVFLIGHSYGGPTVMLNPRPGITAASLWDPSFDLSHILAEYSSRYLAGTGHYAVEWGVTSLIGKAMMEEARRLDGKACAELAKKATFPVQVVFAEKGNYIKRRTSYHSFGHPQNRSDVVKGTTHCFYEGSSCDDLLKTTRAWFAKW